MTNFATDGIQILRGFLGFMEVNTMAQYMENRKKISTGERTDPVSKYSFYADPLTEVILVNALTNVEELTGKELYPAYSYARIYTRGDELKPHVDRPSCEISLTCNVSIDGEPWSIWCQAPGKAPVECVLHPGDAVLYMGCVINHWRKPLEHADYNAQFMLHYVDKNGPYADYKWDRRPSLGLPFSSRRN